MIEEPRPLPPDTGSKGDRMTRRSRRTSRFIAGMWRSAGRRWKRMRRSQSGWGLRGRGFMRTPMCYSIGRGRDAGGAEAYPLRPGLPVDPARVSAMCQRNADRPRKQTFHKRACPILAVRSSRSDPDPLFGIHCRSHTSRKKKKIKQKQKSNPTRRRVSDSAAGSHPPDSCHGPDSVSQHAPARVR